MNSRIGSLVAALESKSAETANDFKTAPPPKRSFSTAKARTPSTASSALPAVADDLAATIKAAIDEQVASKLRELALQNERLEEELQNTRIENEALRRRQSDIDMKLKDLSDSSALKETRKQDPKPSAQLLFNIKKSIREQVFPQLGDLFHLCARHAEQRDQSDAKQRKLEKRLNAFMQQANTQIQCLELSLQELQQQQIHDRAFERFGAKLDGGEIASSLPPTPCRSAFASVKKFRRLGVVYDADFALGKLRSRDGSRERLQGLEAEEHGRGEKKSGWERKLKEKSKRLQSKIGDVERFVWRWADGESKGARSEVR